MIESTLSCAICGAVLTMHIQVTASDLDVKNGFGGMVVFHCQQCKTIKEEVYPNLGGTNLDQRWIKLLDVAAEYAVDDTGIRKRQQLIQDSLANQPVKSPVKKKKDTANGFPRGIVSATRIYEPDKPNAEKLADVVKIFYNIPT